MVAAPCGHTAALGTMMAKDPYCEVYKAVFGRAEAHARTISRRNLPEQRLRRTMVLDET